MFEIRLKQRLFQSLLHNGGVERGKYSNSFAFTILSSWWFSVSMLMEFVTELWELLLQYKFVLTILTHKLFSLKQILNVIKFRVIVLNGNKRPQSERVTGMCFAYYTHTVRIRRCNTGGMLLCSLTASLLHWLVNWSDQTQLLCTNWGQNSELVTKFKGYVNIYIVGIHSCIGWIQGSPVRLFKLDFYSSHPWHF